MVVASHQVGNGQALRFSQGDHGLVVFDLLESLVEFDQRFVQLAEGVGGPVGHQGGLVHRSARWLGLRSR